MCLQWVTCPWQHPAICADLSIAVFSVSLRLWTGPSSSVRPRDPVAVGHTSLAAPRESRSRLQPVGPRSGADTEASAALSLRVAVDCHFEFLIRLLSL